MRENVKGEGEVFFLPVLSCNDVDYILVISQINAETNSLLDST